ncbi:MAG: chromosome segregation protein SMC, partial [Candidatus Aenigmarchaeota archaeon]|nr:chromosome segregation protein SMC [Candidatus Aenigmarchaeota archaeon]
LDNKDHKIPGEDEIKITRKVNEKGLSIFKLNGKVVTRSKILDVLSNLNLSPHGHNIIMQGDVTRIIEMSPIERRGIIDQISGIAEFDEKKRKAEIELEKVERHIRELEIVFVEKQRLLERLKKDIESVEKSQKLNDEIKKVRASLISLELEDLNKDLEEIEKRIEEEMKKFQDFQEKHKGEEKELDDLESEFKKINDEMIERSRSFEITRKIDQINMEIIRRKDKIEMNNRILQQQYSKVARSLLNMPGVIGTVSSVIEVPEKYTIAIKVALGSHANDIIVETEKDAINCIKYLKENKLGRARFLPLDSLKPRKVKSNNIENAIGYALDLVKFDDKVRPAVEYALGGNIITKDLKVAKSLDVSRGSRIVTLEGEILESSGAIIGGYYEKKSFEFSVKKENEKLQKEIEEFQKEIEKLKEEEKEEEEKLKDLKKGRDEIEKKIDKIRSEVGKTQNERFRLQSKIGELKVKKAKLDAEIENLKLELKTIGAKPTYQGSKEELRKKLKELSTELERLGPINMRAEDDYKRVEVEYKILRDKLERLKKERDAVIDSIREIEEKRYDKFMKTLEEISKNFAEVFRDLMVGEAKLRLEEEGNIESGLLIEATAKGKKIVNIDSMSGGEKSLTALAFLFAIQKYQSAPFYILDEVEAALDKVNTKKIVEFIKKYSKYTQFIVVSHNDITIKEADNVYGVTMEDGVSKVFSIKMPGERNE